VKKSPYLAQLIFVKNSTQLLQWKKGSQKTAQSKQSPNMRKLAQSGHPVSITDAYMGECVAAKRL
jgi:hypothetical protein